MKILFFYIAFSIQNLRVEFSLGYAWLSSFVLMWGDKTTFFFEPALVLGLTSKN